MPPTRPARRASLAVAPAAPVAGAPAGVHAPGAAAVPHAPGEDTRARLLVAAVRLFATQGYTRTSTRELAEAAGANIAAISYHFGDKAGLYRAAFVEGNGPSQPSIAAYTAPGLPLDDALRAFFRELVEPLKQGDLARLCVKLHFREMLDPTGLWSDDASLGIAPLHEALLGVLARHAGLAQPDDDLRRLAICIAGLGVHLHVARDVVDVLAPTLNHGDDAWDVWIDRLAGFALAMVEADLARRGAASTPSAR